MLHNNCRYKATQKKRAMLVSTARPNKTYDDAIYSDSTAMDPPK
jgi:hypothetical protein